MYGTVSRFRIKPGSEEELLAVTRDFGANPPPGFVGAYLYRLNSGGDEYITAAAFSDKATYERNSNEPRQQAWFARMSELMVGDPQWSDGEIIDVMSPAGDAS